MRWQLLSVGSGRGTVARARLASARIDVQVARTDVRADHLTLVHLGARGNEEATPLLEIGQGVGRGHAGLAGHQRAEFLHLDGAGVGSVLMEQGMVDAVASGRGEEGLAETEYAPGRYDVGRVHDAGFAIADVGESAPALAEHFTHRAHVVRWHLDVHLLEGLVPALGRLAIDNLRLADGELVALAAHRLDEDGQVQLAATRYDPLAGNVGVRHPQGHVLLQFADQTVADLAVGDVLALAPGEGAGVDRKGHAHRRLFDLDRRQGSRVVDVGDGVPDADALDAGDGDDAAGVDHLPGLALEVAEGENLADAGADRVAGGIHVGHRHARAQ